MSLSASLQKRGRTKRHRQLGCSIVLELGACGESPVKQKRIDPCHIAERLKVETSVDFYMTLRMMCLQTCFVRETLELEQGEINLSSPATNTERALSKKNEPPAGMEAENFRVSGGRGMWIQTDRQTDRYAN